MAVQNLLLPLSLFCSSESLKYYLQLKADLAASFLSESKLGSNYPILLNHSFINTVSCPPQILLLPRGRVVQHVPRKVDLPRLETDFLTLVERLNHFYNFTPHLNNLITPGF
jgi:hypothetical protein